MVGATGIWGIRLKTLWDGKIRTTSKYSKLRHVPRYLWLIIHARRVRSMSNTLVPTPARIEIIIKPDAVQLPFEFEYVCTDLPLNEYSSQFNCKCYGKRVLEEVTATRIYWWTREYTSLVVGYHCLLECIYMQTNKLLSRLHYFSSHLNSIILDNRSVNLEFYFPSTISINITFYHLNLSKTLAHRTTRDVSLMSQCLSTCSKH